MSHILRFDGSLRGVCGGAGAILLHNERVIWQGARFLPRCASSAAAEYEGLLFGMTAAQKLGVTQLHTEGDCSIVLKQLSGSARARKLHHQCVRAMALASSFGLPATYAHIARAENGHADSLSRAAVDAMQALYCSAIRSSLKCGNRDYALRLLDDARRQNVPRPCRIFEDVISVSVAECDWAVVISAFIDAKSSGFGESEIAINGALDAFAARRSALDTKLHASLMRQKVTYSKEEQC